MIDISFIIFISMNQISDSFSRKIRGGTSTEFAKYFTSRDKYIYFELL